jgi:hypothetical protein
MGVASAKVAVFLLFFVAFVIIVRRLFSGGTSPYASEYQLPSPDPPDDLFGSNRPAVIGAELPFPVGVPPVQQLTDGRYNRPNVLNYYFSNLDLKSGPPNPRSFCDQLFVEFEAPETGARWTSEYTVATPFGLQDLMDQTGQKLVFDGTVIIVPRWDMAQILKTVLDDMMERYATSEPETGDKDDALRRYQG